VEKADNPGFTTMDTRCTADGRLTTCSSGGVVRGELSEAARCRVRYFGTPEDLEFNVLNALVTGATAEQKRTHAERQLTACTTTDLDLVLLDIRFAYVFQVNSATASESFMQVDTGDKPAVFVTDLGVCTSVYTKANSAAGRGFGFRAIADTITVTCTEGDQKIITAVVPLDGKPVVPTPDSGLPESEKANVLALEFVGHSTGGVMTVADILTELKVPFPEGPLSAEAIRRFSLSSSSTPLATSLLAFVGITMALRWY